MLSSNSNKPGPDDKLSLKIAIVSCRELLIGDLKTSDPYVKVSLGFEDLHKTKHILKTLDPVYSLEENNTFVWNGTYKDLTRNGGFEFRIKDWDRIGSNDELGSVQVSAEQLIEMTASSNDNEKEFAIGGSHSIKVRKSRQSTSEAGYLTLKIQHATDEDRKSFNANASGPFWTPGEGVEVTTTETTTSTPKMDEMEKGLEEDQPNLVNEEATPPPPSNVPRPNPDKEMKILVEIMSCHNLIAGDKTGNSDPYVKVTLGHTKKELHKTKHIHKTLNPVFDDGIFLLDIKAKELLDHDGLVLEVKDWDRGIGMVTGGNDPLGNAHVPAKDLYSLNDWDQPREYKISPPKGKESIKDAGYVKIRFRSATSDDEHIYGKRKGLAKILHPHSPKILQKGAIRGAAANILDRGLFSSNAADKIKIPEEDKELFIEIVSCRDLLAADKSGLSDPYVKILMGKKELHKTQHVVKTLNPQFSKEHNNFMVLDCTAKDLFTNGGLEFKVRDWDRGIGGDDELGSVFVPAEVLYNCFEDSQEFKINPPKGKADEAGYISIRCRPPHLGDKEDYRKAKAPLAKLRGSGPGVSSAEADPVDLMHVVNIEDKILLIEIVSCRDLLAADKSGASDPYVKIKMGSKNLHETDHLRQTLNPIFTKKTKNSYVLDKSAMEVYGQKGIQLKVKDWDRGFGGNDELGTANIPADTLYNFGTETREFKMDPPSGKKDDAGYISLRVSEIDETERDSRKKGFFRNRKPATKSRELDFSDLSLLIEIVSCQDLIKADLRSSDPYVSVVMGTETVHKTDYISKTIDPIYTVSTGSLFILKAVKQELCEGEGLLFIVKDYDRVGGNDELGHVQVSGKVLCEANGERMALPLEPPKGSKQEDAGKLNIRCRPATNYDKKFLEYAAGNMKGDFLGINQRMDIIMNPSGGERSLIKQKVSMMDAGVKKYRVRPGPDPQRPSKTQFLSKEEIEAEAISPSRKWIDIGSGTHGKLYVEIIGADGLPNLDSSVRGRDKSDPFAILVYGDCCAKTDVIDDCLSPKWLPWMQRAFVLNLNHSSSDIFVGVFDHDASFGNSHDLIGRATIETSGLEPNTEYTLSFNLHKDLVEAGREPQGSITLRIRVEFTTPRELVLSNLQLPSEEYINVKKKKDFKLIQQVIGGETDLQSYSLNTITLYVNELTSYSFIQYYVRDAIESLLLWRGQVPFLFGFKIPLHSMIAFFAAITVAERPSLWFSYVWFGHAWLLLAIQNYRNNTPHPWTKTKTFGQILCMLILNRAMGGSETISAYDHEEEATNYETQFKERIEKAETAAEKRREEELKILEEHEKEMAELDEDADTDIATKSSGISIDPLKKFLYPVQQHLATVCAGVRFVRNVYIWHEPYFAFFLTATSILVGIVFLLVPWAFVLHWTGRIVAWVVFGPHMKLVDIFYYKKMKAATDEEERESLLSQYRAKLSQARANDELAFTRTEDAAKLKVVKKILYGKWIAKVPVINPERYLALPLHKSYAEPYEPAEDSTRSLPLRIAGQGLAGDMIPRLKDLDHGTKSDDASTSVETKGSGASPETTDEEATGASEKTPLLASSK